MVKRKVYFTLDCAKPGNQYTVEGLHVGDKRSCEFHILLRNGIVPLSFDDENIAVIMNAQKPDGTTISTLCDISEDKKEVVYTLDVQDATVAGIVNYELIIAAYDGENYCVLYSATFSTVVSTGVIVPVFKKLDSEPDDWATGYKKYFRHTQNGYEKITDDTCPTFNSNDFYFLVNPNYDSENDYSAFEQTVANVQSLLLRVGAVEAKNAEQDADISGKEDKANKVESNMASAAGTGYPKTKYPSVYAVWEYLSNYFYSRSEIDNTTYTKEEVDTALAGKAAVDHTHSEYLTAQDISGKYEKPSGGIPKTDLSSEVQASLGKADSALQSHQSLANYYNKTEVDAVVRNQKNALTNTNGNYIYSNDIVTNASDKFGTVKTQNAPIASFGNYTNGLAVGNVGEKVTRGTQVYWYRYEIDAKSFTNYKIKYYGVKNPNVSDYIIVVDKNDIILAKHGESQSAAGYATKTFTTPANTCKIIVNSGSGTATLQGMYITPIDLQKQVNSTSVTMDGKISIPNSELTPSDSGTGFLTDDGFGNVYVNTNANWNWKKFAVISGVYFVSTVKAANASLTYDYVYVTDSSGLIKSSYIHPSSGGGLVSDEKIEVLENGYIYVQTFDAAQTSKMKCKDSTYIFDELLRKNNEFESYEKNVFGGYALPTFSSSENNLTVKVPNKGVFVCEQGSSNNAFKYITPTQNTFSLNNLQLLVLNKSTNDIEIIHQSTFLNNLGSYIVLVWNYYGQVRGQWYLYYIAQQLNSGYHTMMQEVTNKYISRQGKFYVDGIHENTVDAIKYAKSKGYNHIRVSVCFTSDGYGVLSHFNELADLQGAERKDGEPISTETISGMTITELDADYEYYGESFARLDDAVALCKQINMELTLEIKSSFNGSQQKSIDVLRAYGMNKHTFWSCSSISQINSIVSIDNKANVAYIVHLSSISDVDSLYAVNTTGEKRLDIYSNDTYDATIWAYARSKDITIKYGSVYNINTAVAMAPYCDYLECADIEYPALAIYQKTS